MYIYITYIYILLINMFNFNQTMLDDVKGAVNQQT